MKRLLLIPLLFIFKFSIGQDGGKAEAQCSGFRFTTIAPTLVLDKMVLNDTNHTYVYSIEKYLVYQLPYKHFDAGLSTRYLYLVTHRDSLYGYCFKEGGPGDNEGGIRAEVSKIVGEYSGLWDVPVNPILHNPNLIFRKTRQNISGDSIEDVYELVNRIDSIVLGQLKLNYSGSMNEFDYTLSRDMDSVFNAANKDIERKLVLIDCNFKRHYDNISKQTNEAFRMYYGVEKIPVTEKSKLILMVDRYKRAIQHLP